jgi:hypothetical protein
MMPEISFIFDNYEDAVKLFNELVQLDENRNKIINRIRDPDLNKKLFPVGAGNNCKRVEQHY